MNIGVSCVLNINNKNKKNEELLDHIYAEARKQKNFWVEYNIKEIYLIQSKNDLSSIAKEHLESISGNVYILLNEDKDILYVGKSKSIKKRIKEHLVKCSSSTSSQIQNVYDFLKEKNLSGKDNIKIYIFVLNVEPNEYYGTIEGLIINDLIKKSNNTCWNVRQD